MPPLQHAELTLEADVDGDGTTETGVFVFAGLSVTPGVRTGFLVGGRGSSVNSIISRYILENPNSDLNQRRGVHLDAGGGQHTIEIEFDQWEGATLSDGTPAQWGNDPNASRTQASATGQGPITQIDVLMRYLTVGTFDSNSPATLEYGEFSSGGLYDPLEVVLEGPQFTRAADDGSWFTGTLTCITTISTAQAIDAVSQEQR